MPAAPKPVSPQKGGLLWARIIVFLLILGATGIMLTFPNVPAPFDRCQILYFTGYPCPACGITHGLYALIHGQFKDAFIVYPFAYPVAFGIVIAVIGIFLPNRLWKRLMDIRWISWSLGIGTATTILGILICWFLRLLQAG